jgi:hypothetical protein
VTCRKVKRRGEGYIELNFLAGDRPVAEGLHIWERMYSTRQNRVVRRENCSKVDVLKVHPEDEERDPKQRQKES